MTRLSSMDIAGVGGTMVKTGVPGNPRVGFFTSLSVGSDDLLTFRPVQDGQWSASRNLPTVQPFAMKRLRTKSGAFEALRLLVVMISSMPQVAHSIFNPARP